MSDQLDTQSDHRDGPKDGSDPRKRDAAASTDVAPEGDLTARTDVVREAGPQVRDTELADAASAEQVTGATSLWSDGWRVLKKSPMFWLSAAIIVTMIVMAIYPEAFLWFYGNDPNASGTCALQYSINSSTAPGGGRPTTTNWFGFNLQGCDMYVRTILGARISIFVGVTVTIGAVILATIFGTLAGYYGGIFDSIIARITDIWFAVPTILAAIVLLSVLGSRDMFTLAFVLTLFGWPSMLRLMRSQVIAVKEQDFVTASRSLGASDMRLMVRHILPNGMTPVIVYATIFIGAIITAEAALSFLGVGVQTPAISWGLMISTAQDFIITAPHLLFFPGLFLAVTVFGFILMGDVLRDAFDPKGR